MFNLNRYQKIFKMLLKSKIVFKSPKSYELVIFDDESFSDFKNFIYHYNFFVLQSRIDNINKIYFNLKIFKLFLKNYKGNIMTAYLVSLLEIIKPKLVITNIDNSFKFFDLARILDKKTNFVAIQNAARYDIKELQYTYKKGKDKINLIKYFYLPNFFVLVNMKLIYINSIK